MSVELTLGQKAFARVAYDQEWPTDPSEELLALEIFVTRIDAEHRRRLVNGVFGARGGKTYTLVSLRLLHGALTRDLSVLAPGQKAYAPIIAPVMDLACEGVNYVSGAIKSKPELKSLLVADTTEGVSILRPDGEVVSIRAFAASRGGLTGRGKCLTDAALDECCLFRSGSYAVNDKEIYKAVSIRVLPGGQTLQMSTPMGEEGELYQRWKEGTTRFSLVGRASTRIMNDADWILEIIEEEERKDPENAQREFGANFVSNFGGRYFSTSAIEESAKDFPMDDVESSKFTVQPRWVYAAGADFAFVRNSAALVIVGFNGTKYRTVLIKEKKPEPGKPLKPSEVVGEFAGIIKKYGIRSIVTDPYYRESVREHLSDSGLSLEDAPTDKGVPHGRTRTVLHEGQCEFPEGSELLRQQVREISHRPKQGGGVTIFSPVKPDGRHGDIASGWVLAVHKLAHARVEPEREKAPPFGTREYEAWAAHKADKEMMEQDMKRYGKAGRDEW